MKKITKVLSVLMAAVMLMTALCVPASAASIEDTAKKISSGSKVSGTMYKGESLAFKVNVNKKGILKINFTAKCEYMDVYVYDKNGNKIDESDVQYVSGNSWSIYDIGESYIDFEWNEKVEKIQANLQYTVEKGTYYIEFYRGRSADGSGKLNFTATFPSSSTSSSSSSAKISYLSIEVSKGSKMQLAAVVSAKTSQSVSWSSSKSSVVSVTSKGKITAKAKGTAVITAKLGSSTMKIRIKVV